MDSICAIILMLFMCRFVAAGLHFFYYALVNIKYFPRRLSTYTFDLLFDTQYKDQGEQTPD